MTRNLDIDDPHTTYIRREIIQSKPFLKKIYEDWYNWIAVSIPQGDGGVLELGSGAGFLDKYVPGLITSEVFFCPHVKVILDGCFLPFPKGSLKAIVLVDVFHHIPNVDTFLFEAATCLKEGGKILMVEPWVTTWSSFVYGHLHHESFVPECQSWSFLRSGPLTSANLALPWVVFGRDRAIFKERYKQFAINNITLEKPFVYILSGGVSFRSFLPGILYCFINRLETMLGRWMGRLGMFSKIELSRVEE